MIPLDLLIVLSSRIIAAVANLAAVAIFTRMVATPIYGLYILIFSYAFIIYGVFVQWLHIAFFALARKEISGAQIATLLTLALAALCLFTTGASIAAISGIITWQFAAALCALTAGLSLYNIAVEISRTMLKSRLLAAVLLTRSICLIPFGVTALAIDTSAASLAFGLAFAYLAGGLVIVPWLLTQGLGRFDIALVQPFLKYGWPLLLSFGVMGVAQNTDRILIGNLIDAQTLGSYAAIADILRQSFTVLGEAVALSIISEARHEYVSGVDRAAKSQELLTFAFRTLIGVVTLGATFLISFKSELVQVILGPPFRPLATELFPFLVVAYSIFVFRAYFFGQTIYFQASSMLELMSAIVTILTIVALAYLLTPVWGIYGYAFALAAAQIAAITIFIFGDRSQFRMPVCWRSTVEGLALGFAIVVLCQSIDLIGNQGIEWKVIALKMLVFSIGCMIALWRFDPFSIGTMCAGYLRSARPAPDTILDNRLRLLMIIKFRSVGGTQTLAGLIKNGLNERDFAITEFYLYPSPSASLLQRLKGLIRAAIFILTGRFQAICTFDVMASLLAGVFGSLARCPVRMVHQTVLPEQVASIQRGLDLIAGTIGLYSINVTNSVTTTNAFASYPSAYRRKIELIPHGVAIPHQSLSRSETWKKFGIPSDGKILLNIGRLANQKNQDVVIPVLKQRLELRLVIAGDGPNAERYLSLAQSLGVGDRLHLLGAVQPKDIPNLFYASDIFVFPSTWESFGFAAVEAGMSGIPIIASDIPVLREVLCSTDIDAVSFVDTRSPEEWLAAIDRVLANDPDMAMRRESLKEVLQKIYSTENMMARYVDLLSKGRAPNL
jgi:glycosyltransferase involved in cell wall biosynthesis/O-antigen/teichoic acid export membrane protein